ncbi:hypothetical protein [Methanobrevibacter sp.]|uniref:hypothetical protein n=1 Tax=Methanobrevibacter sp. TaxID=66852 RepID=UPI003863D6CA
MNKIILSLLCLLIVSMGVACVAASDNTTMTHDSIQTIDQQHIPVDTNITVENGINNDAANTADNGTVKAIDDAVTVDNDTVKVADNTANAQQTNNSTQPHLDIKGPKIIKNNNLNIKGPKGPIKLKPMTEYERTVYHYFTIFIKHPEWDLHRCAEEVFRTYNRCNYWKETSKIIAEAHNQALFQYRGNDMVIKKNLNGDEVYQYVTEGANNYYFGNIVNERWSNHEIVFDQYRW